jgi:hypothetical protein
LFVGINIDTDKQDIHCDLYPETKCVDLDKWEPNRDVLETENKKKDKMIKMMSEWIYLSDCHECPIFLKTKIDYPYCESFSKCKEDIISYFEKKVGEV